MSPSNKVLIRKVAVVLAPAFLFLLFLYLFLPYARKHYVQLSWDMTAVEHENIVVYAPNRSLAEHVRKTFTEFRTVFLREYRGTLDPDRKPLRIHVFEDGDQLSEYYSQKKNRKLPNNSGYYDPTDQAIALELVSKPVLDRAIRHEAVHYLMDMAGSSTEWSTWLSEGLASVYQHYEITTGRDGTLQWRLTPEERRMILDPYGNAVDMPRSIEDFLRVNEKNFRHHNNRAFYRQARLFVYFLLNEYPSSFWEYVEYERQNGPGRVEDFRRVVGAPDRLERELKRWVRNRKSEDKSG